MAGVPPNSQRPDELPEYAFIGPFGGIQSEVSLSQIGRSGFADVQNVMLRKSHSRTFPGFTALASPSGEVIIGIADFFNVNGIRLFVVWTPTKMYAYIGGVWTQITGVLHGNTSQFMQWDVIGYKLYFSQQADQVMVWDGLTAGFTVIATSVPAKYVCELDFHLLIANTVEAGPTPAPNRLRWSGAGDGTDWTSFNSGQEDIFNGLGPVNGLARIYQAGYAFQQWGITQIVPTGNGLAPFQLIPMGSRSKGSILPYGVATFGEMISCYVGKDDVYVFDGTQSIGIGSHPIDGNRRLGARVRIFQDLFTANLTNIYGFIMSNANGFEYEAYWLFMPSLNKAWIYHFDEQNWTQLLFTVGQLVGPTGCAPLQTLTRIEDLIGTIAAQAWSPATLNNANQLDTMAISDAIANSVSFLNPAIAGSYPTSGSINANDGWYIRSGQLTFDDPRHAHTVKKFRLIIEDYSPGMVFNVRVSNEYGQSQTQKITVGTGSGNSITQVVSFSISGKYITWELSGPQGVTAGMVEFTPIYDVAGEVQGGTR
jgi:hypothetical protein